ncbi:MAG: RNA-binding S4 domain-containing protein [Sphingomonadaceae bacterium]
MAETGMRLDRFLWFARLCPSRRVARDLVAEGHLRIDGRAVTKPSTIVRIGTVLTFPTPGGRVAIVRIEALPVRRGPAAEARATYTDLVIDGGSPQT